MLMAVLLLAQVPAQDEVAPCDAAPAEVLVGERYRRHVPTRARKLSGARTVRVAWPGQMMTDDFREDRLTIRVDHRRTITDVSCG